MNNKRSLRSVRLMHELTLYTEARNSKNHERCLEYLGRAHIISQLRWFHFYIHFLMLEYSYERKDFKEALSQLLRMLLTVPGHLLNRIPKGNTGWSSIGLNQELPLPEDLKKYLE